MAASLSWNDKRSINTWWQKGIDKERQRLTNAPKPFKGDKFSVPEDISNFVPPLKRMKKSHAR
jgi:hypothetical protein